MPQADSVPPSFGLGCVVSAFGLLLTGVHHRHLVRTLHATTTFSAKRCLYRLIVSLAPALAVVNFIAVTSPPMHKECAMAQHAIVAFVMACFMELLLLLCYRMSLADSAGDEASVPGITNVLEHFEASVSSLTPQFAPSKFIDGCVAVLSRQPDINFWASPPIGCCFALCPGLPCGRRQRLSAKLLVLLRRAVLCAESGASIEPATRPHLDCVGGRRWHLGRRWSLGRRWHLGRRWSLGRRWYLGRRYYLERSSRGCERARVLVSHPCPTTSVYVLGAVLAPLLEQWVDGMHTCTRACMHV